MADNQPMIASAVVVPDQPSPSLASAPPSPRSPTTHKRRHSSISNSDSKRPRLNTDEAADGAKENGTRGSPEHERRISRQRNGQAEERKRGKRLFGALLGTLSQSSTSTAQKRREIERKQQAKIKQQAEEDDQTTRQKVEELRKERIKEQRIYDEQAMRARHSNKSARANFLQTKSEPRLYFRPWDLRPEEEDQIKQQIEDAQAQNEVELEDHRHKREEEREDQEISKEDPELLTDAQPEQQPEIDKEQHSPEQVGSKTTEDSVNPNDAMNGDTNRENTLKSDQESSTTAAEEPDRDGGDDNGEEMLEAEEDTVLY